MTVRMINFRVIYSRGRVQVPKCHLNGRLSGDSRCCSADVARRGNAVDFCRSSAAWKAFVKHKFK